MTKEMEKEIDDLYEFLEISTDGDREREKAFDTDGRRTNVFFEKRWDSSFFANAMRY